MKNQRNQDNGKNYLLSFYISRTSVMSDKKRRPKRTERCQKSLFESDLIKVIQHPNMTLKRR